MSGSAMESAVADVIPGGQLLGQGIVAAVRTQPAKEVKTIHLVFTRVGRMSEPLELVVDTVHAGGSFGTVGLTFEQNGRPISKGVALLHAPEPDLIRHAAPMREVEAPDSHGTAIDASRGYEVGTVKGADTSREDDVGPPELPMWVRFPGAPSGGAINQALLAFATNFNIITASLRPHEGFNLGQAHVRMSTGVIGHTITLHEAVPAGEWLLLDQEAPYAGRGRVYGRGNVFTQGGHLVASFVQDAMVRALGEAPPSGRKGAAL